MFWSRRGPQGGFSRRCKPFIERGRAEGGQVLQQFMAQARPSRRRQRTKGSSGYLRFQYFLGIFNDRREDLLEGAGLACVNSGAGRALEGGFNPDRVFDPGRNASLGFAANTGKPCLHLLDGQPIAAEAAFEQTLIFACSRAAPGGEAPVRRIGCNLIAGERKIIGKQFVDCGGTQQQALVKGVHRFLRTGAVAVGHYVTRGPAHPLAVAGVASKKARGRASCSVSSQLRKRSAN